MSAPVNLTRPALVASHTCCACTACTRYRTFFHASTDSSARMERGLKKLTDASGTSVLHSLEGGGGSGDTKPTRTPLWEERRVRGCVERAREQ